MGDSGCRLGNLQTPKGMLLQVPWFVGPCSHHSILLRRKNERITLCDPGHFSSMLPDLNQRLGKGVCSLLSWRRKPELGEVVMAKRHQAGGRAGTQTQDMVLGIHLPIETPTMAQC